MKRIYEEVVHRHLTQLRQMVFLMGPRQVGKTTLGLASAGEAKHHFYFNWDNAAERLLFIDGPDAIATQAGLDVLSESIPIVFFDELHK